MTDIDKNLRTLRTEFDYKVTARLTAEEYDFLRGVLTSERAKYSAEQDGFWHCSRLLARLVDDVVMERKASVDGDLQGIGE